MPDFNKGDFTQQGVNGHVNATVRLNEKRLVNIDLTTDEDAEGCTITGQITDLLNNIVYPLAEVPGLYDFLGKDTELFGEAHETINLRNDTNWSSWTPSSTATDITSGNKILITPSDHKIETGYVYVGLVLQRFYPVYTEEVPTYALQVCSYLDWRMLRRIYGTASSYENKTMDTWGWTNLQSQGFQYYLSNAGSPTLGSYSVPVRPVGAQRYQYNVTSDGFNLYRNQIQARTDSAYFPSATVAKIDRSKTNLVIDAYVFKTPAANSTLTWLYNTVTDVEPAE